MDAQARKAFEETALPVLDNLYGAAMRLTRNESDAQDLVQDAAVRAYRFWGSFKPGTSVKAWLFTILRNTFINRYHRENRAREASSNISSQADILEGVGAAVPSSGSRPQGPDVRADALITRARIEEALKLVPEDYREAVVLADLEGFAYKEIAEIIGCPMGTVMSRIYRGRKLLHRLLFDHAVETGRVEPASTSSPQKGTLTDPVALSDYRKKRGA